MNLLHTDLLPTDPNPYIITYKSKFVCNYLRILLMDLLHTDPTDFSVDNINN